MALQRAELPNIPGLSLPSGSTSRSPKLTDVILGQIAAQVAGNVVSNALGADQTNVAVEEGLLGEKQRRDGLFRFFKDPLTQEELEGLRKGKSSRESDTTLNELRRSETDFNKARTDKLRTPFTLPGVDGVEQPQGEGGGFWSGLLQGARDNPISNYIFGAPNQDMTPEQAAAILASGGTGDGQAPAEPRTLLNDMMNAAEMLDTAPVNPLGLESANQTVPGMPEATSTMSGGQAPTPDFSALTQQPQQNQSFEDLLKTIQYIQSLQK